MTDQNYIYHETEGVPIKTWTKGVPVEDSAMDQLRNVASLPFIHKHVAAMPDVHWGMGVTIGSVIPTKGAIIPAAVGVDIGCGMCATRTNLTASDLPDNLSGMRSAIEAAIPHGRTNHGKPGDRGAWGNAPANAKDAFNVMRAGIETLIDKHPKLLKTGTIEHRGGNHMGTLGTGNHFIEVCLDEDNCVWIMLHSGSRGIGNAIGMYFINLAKQDMRKWFINLPDDDLAYLPEGTDHFTDYVRAVEWAQKYAATNRAVMMERAKDAMSQALGRPIATDEEALDCHHNYVARENHFGANIWLTRKGAVRARKGDLGIIPGSMGVKSYIVRGKGNADSFHSCSHGAGRAMSRGEAKRTFTLDDHAKATEGVECRKDDGVIDETPGAYKDIDAVMAAQSDLVDVVHTLKQVVCVKG